MKEKILALLIAKFSGVRKDGLAQLAASLTLQAADETEATALIEKLTDDKVNNFVKDWRKDVDKEVSDANKTYKKTIEEKFDLVEKKADEKKAEDQKSDEPPAWAKALIEQNKTLSEKLSSFEGAKTTETRLQQLQSKFAEKNLPESFIAQKLKDFKRMNFESEESFTEYLTEVETDITTFNQELADKGLVGQGRPVFGSKNKEGVSSGVADYLQSKSDNNSLGGKEI